MARAVYPDDPGGGGQGDPGDPGYTPPSAPGTKLAAVVTATNITFTAEQIAAAGGPWPAFTLRVTAVNDKGSGPAAELEYP